MDRPGLTVRGWLALVLSTMGLLVLIGALVGALLLDRIDEESRSLQDDIQPSRVSAFRLQSGLRDQETGLRGYLISADRQFLSPYYDGLRTEAAASQEIRKRLSRHPDLIADLDAIEAAAAKWRRDYAEPLIARVTPNTPIVLPDAMSTLGKGEFDHLRALFGVQNEHLTNAREHGAAKLVRMSDWRDRMLGAMVLIFVGTAALLGLLVQRSVTRPLEQLAASCRRITDGHFSETIPPPARPADIRGIAVDVERMRQRIVTELDSSRSAQAQLDEQASELRRSNAELEQFAYVASHDLQEPLRKVASFCQLLEKRYSDKLDERGIEYINFAVDGAKRMQVLINDLLSFSRVGRLNTRYGAVALDTTLDMALGNLAAAREESGAEIVRPRQLPEVFGDSTLLTQLWQNLIGNAIKFRRDDVAPRVVIDCRQGSAGDDDFWSITVTDNGIGIPAEFSDKVFVIFQRLHGRDAYTGTGLGLALCKKIVEHHGGTICIDTTYTGGTRFEFTLPVATRDSAENHLATVEGASDGADR
ncbi:histidine kinase [Mycobacterium asiaticum]|uniref:histidine kinase n=2 Tax=Mycobacterium asiaticum TaxID=1790 RepID=A0A1A3NCT4_MYCAS|nr:histidine kinase [Mycobacterium asiaticum]